MFLFSEVSVTKWYEAKMSSFKVFVHLLLKPRWEVASLTSVSLLPTLTPSHRAPLLDKEQETKEC